MRVYIFISFMSFIFCNKDLECILGFNLKLSCIFILSQTIACIVGFCVIVKSACVRACLPRFLA